MSNKNRFYSLCRSEKIGHHTREDAQAQIDKLAAKGQRVDRIHVYTFPHCGFYHIGHRSRAQEWKMAWQRKLLLRRIRNK